MLTIADFSVFVDGLFSGQGGRCISFRQNSLLRSDCESQRCALCKGMTGSFFMFTLIILRGTANKALKT